MISYCMGPSFYQRLKRMGCFWRSQLMADEWQSVSPTQLLSRNEEALTCGNPDVSLEEDWPHLSQDGFYTARPPLFLWPASCPLLLCCEWVSLARRNSQRKPDAVALNLLCGICINSLHNAVQPPSGLCHLWATPIISILVNSSSESRNIIFFCI